jgi:hypothetical protein
MEERRRQAVRERAPIRWNVVDGPLLGSASGSPFSVPAVIPQAPDGVYALVAFERDSNGGIVGVTRSTFQVMSEAGAPVATGGPPGTVREVTSAPSRVFVAAIGVLAGLVLLLSGGVWGASLARRRPHPASSLQDTD